jgi:hypothetical protein
VVDRWWVECRFTSRLRPTWSDWPVTSLLSGGAPSIGGLIEFGKWERKEVEGYDRSLEKERGALNGRKKGAARGRAVG